MARRSVPFRLLLLLLLLAGIGYIVYVGGSLEKQSTALAEIQKLGGSFDIRPQPRRAPGEPAPPPPSLGEEVFGADMLAEVTVVQLGGTEVTDGQLSRILRDLPSVEYLGLNNTAISDAGTAVLGRLKHLKSLSLSSTHVTDAGLENLRPCKELEILQLSDTRISDAGLGPLTGLPELRRLWVDGTGVTDAGMENLVGLPKLERLFVKGSKVGPQGIDKLKGAMPMLVIE